MDCFRLKSWLKENVRVKEDMYMQLTLSRGKTLQPESISFRLLNSAATWVETKTTEQVETRAQAISSYNSHVSELFAFDFADFNSTFLFVFTLFKGF